MNTLKKGLVVHILCGLCVCVYYLAAMLQKKLQDVQVLVLNGDGHSVSAQHVYTVDVQLAVSVLLEELLHHVVVAWGARQRTKRYVMNGISLHNILTVLDLRAGAAVVSSVGGRQGDIIHTALAARQTVAEQAQLQHPS